MENTNLLFPAQEALSGLRDSGIKNTASAISEIIDNSVDAGANHIEVLVFEKPQRSGARTLDKIDKICILDNGTGMNLEILNKCLSVGGRDDGDDDNENHTGRFGYGLPNSSMSQCKKVEVYSWQEKNKINYTYLDYDEVKEKKLQYCQPAYAKDIPDDIKKNLKNSIGSSGTIIIWSKCDRLDIARGDTLYNHMNGDLCRVFRHRLDDDETYGKKVKINYKIAEKNFDKTFHANDPVYLLKPNTTPGFEKQQTNLEVYNQDIPITYLDDDNKKQTSNVRLIFSVSKPSIQALGGASKLGKHYAKNTGISVVRCAREISFKTFGFFDRFEQRNRWWGCEIRYDGEGNINILKKIDSIFGLTNNKQEVTKFYYEDTKLAEEVYGEDEYEERKKTDLSLQMRLAISKRFRDIHSEHYKVITSRGAGKKKGGSSGNSSVDLVNKVLGDDDKKTRSFIEAQNKTEQQKKEELQKIIKQSDPEIDQKDLEEETIAALKRKVDIQFGEWPGEQFFTVRLAGNAAVGIINKAHPYYKDFYDKLLQKEDSNDIKTVDMLLMAFVRMEDEMYSMRDDIEKIRNRWGRYLQDFMEELKKNN